MKTLKEIYAHVPEQWKAQGITLPSQLTEHVLWGTPGFGWTSQGRLTVALARECVRLYAEVERLKYTLNHIATVATNNIEAQA